MILPSRVIFADKKIKRAFFKLKKGKYEDKRLYELLERAFKDIEEDAFSTTHIPKDRIPAEYKKKYGIDNLWKYDLPNGWRLLYSVARKELIVVSIVIEWYKHSKYERRFGY
ncbi:MAG: hypothetical protein ABH854_00920 [Candidatus Diapherotrites archaeon]|nr:hypothetical protein [Candidatus Micrarchaeota archaeon]